MELYNEDSIRQSAVSERNKDIIISAGAGSGKTTVLTQRLISRVRDDRECVTDFLVVTFMKAAAQDIRDQLTEKLTEAVALNPGDTHLERQLALIPQANINTISAYCLSLVKENFSLLGISPKLRVLDEAESKMILSTACDELISDLYASEDEKFMLLVDNFSGIKSDDKLSKELISLYNSLRVNPEWKELLRKSASSLREESRICAEKGFFATKTGTRAREFILRDYNISLESIKAFYGDISLLVNDQCNDIFEKLISGTSDILAAAQENYVNYCNAAAAVCNVGKLYKPTDDPDMNKRISENKSKLTSELKKLASKYSHGSEEEICSEFIATAEITEAVLSFLVALDAAYTAAKSALGSLDYSDFELKALQLLESKDENGNRIPTELCLKKRSAFKEILIDEYQDVNPMQDRIFTLLAGGSNRFMVGDVKQSIYRFRNAYPEIFLGYKDKFADILPGTPQENARIFLRLNFRCARPIINYVNHLFFNVTKDTPYYNEYDNQWLCYGRKEDYASYPVVVAVVEKDGKSGNGEEDSHIGENARRTEADYIAKTITELVKNGKNQEGKALTYKDFAVMLGAMKGYSIPYEKAFNAYGIPYKSETSEDFTENPDIQLALAVLKCIDDPTDDISLCAAMRSPICSFTSDELYKIRLHSMNTPFFAALTKTSLPARNNNRKFKKYTVKRHCGEGTLCAKCRAFLRRLTDWRHESAGVPCKEFLKGFFVSSGLLNICIADGKRESLLMLYEYAAKYETSSYLGLSGFIDYIGELTSSERKLNDVSHSGEENAVSFITVHKSKGLQYTVCFLAGTDKRFKFNGETNITLRRNEGISFPLRNIKRMTHKNTYSRIVASECENQDVVGEELRKLYVALTRAKERLYITGVAENGYAEKHQSIAAAKSWLDMITYLDEFGERDFFVRLCLKSEKAFSGYLAGAGKNTILPTEKMLEAAAYEYPFMKEAESKSKISVSELRTGLSEGDEYPEYPEYPEAELKIPLSKVEKLPSFAASHYYAPAGEIGTANHLFMQFCNFESIESEGIRAEAKRLLGLRMFDEKQYNMLDFESLSAFFASELYKKIKRSAKVFREKRFSVRDKLSENSEELLVQGVIDCFFENPDGTYTVIDYKTDRVNDENVLIERHKTQLLCYCRAVKKITGKDVSDAFLWSFALGREVKVK